MTQIATKLAAVTLVFSTAAGAWQAASRGLEPSAAPEKIAFFRKPFAGEHRVLNAFDHFYPLRSGDRNGRAVDWRGRGFRANRAQDGHAGYDFAMPVGTPILAVAKGQVAQAGSEEPHSCHLLPGLTSALRVKLFHTLPSSEHIITNYVHLSRVDVRVGDMVEEGQQLGLSGNTGCSTAPHLHFAASRQFHTVSGKRTGAWFDPSGWRGRGGDPWAAHPEGAASSRMWRDGEAPRGL